jgi:hypothetical protein
MKGTSFNEATQRLNQHAYNGSCHLLISGLIRPVSIQCRPEPDDFEKAYPLARKCLVLEDSQLLSLRDSSLVSAVDCTPGNKSHEEVDGQRSTTQGTFCADYCFWNTETGFLEALQHVYFLFLGIGVVPNSGWVAGMVLKPRSGQSDEPHCSYQRIGWLRYCPPEAVKMPEWMSQGTALTLKLF